MALLKQINIIKPALTAARVQGTCLLRICVIKVDNRDKHMQRYQRERM